MNQLLIFNLYQKYPFKNKFVIFFTFILAAKKKIEERTDTLFDQKVINNRLYIHVRV